jgi:hypothetical protein
MLVDYARQRGVVAGFPRGAKESVAGSIYGKASGKYDPVSRIVLVMVIFAC